MYTSCKMHMIGVGRLQLGLGGINTGEKINSRCQRRYR